MYESKHSDNLLLFTFNVGAKDAIRQQWMLLTRSLTRGRHFQEWCTMTAAENHMEVLEVL
jgi:hypothetical protein